MVMVISGLQIASGYNNAGSLTNIETLSDANGIRFNVFEDFGNYDGGVDIIRGDMVTVEQGKASTRWRGHLTHGQYYYLFNTLLSGARSGKVTIRTRRYQLGTYANYNAVLTLPKVTTLTYEGIYYRDVELLFTNLDAL